MSKLWQRCLERLESELGVEDIHAWLKPLQAVEQSGQLRLLAPNSFVLDSVRERFLAGIEAVARQLEPGLAGVRLEVGSLAAPPPRTPRREGHATAVPEWFESNLDPHYTFEHFVEGKSNELGKAAALQVAMNPGRTYNPLLLYGGTGLGKTHLMHAAGNLMRQHNPGVKVLYQRSEQFFSAMVKALSNKTAGSRAIDEFKHRYRSVDALLLDDIQFFAGKEGTQEQFFYTFNTLIEEHKQVIITSDTFPKDMEGIEERLKSRFSWGLTVMLEPPELEMRVAILLDKARLEKANLDEGTAFFIAKQVRSNVRELEGALKRVIAFARFNKQSISVELAKEALKDLLAVQNRQISIENIQKTVADYFKIKVADMYSKKRTRVLARPRQMAMYLARELTDLSFPEIGQSFGGRDHTTVLHACAKIEELKASDPGLRKDYSLLIQVLTG